MRLYQVLFLASISKTIANPLASDLPAPDFNVFSITNSDNQDWNVRPPADSSSVTTFNGISGSSDSGQDSLNKFGLDNQNGQNFGSIPKSISIKTDISKNECASGTAQAPNNLQTRQECFPMAADENPFAEEDAADAAWVEIFRDAFPKQDVGENILNRQCGLIPGLQQLPLCCRDPAIYLGMVPNIRVVYDFCVEFIPGRPRCGSSRSWKCCWMLGFGLLFPTRGVDCRNMILV